MRIDTVRAAVVLAAMLIAVSGCASAPNDSEITGPIVLVAVPGGVAATSMQHGPFRVHTGRARGFTHDAVGAALAASHIGPRITSAAERDIAEATLNEQCWGDVRGAVTRLATAQPAPDRPPRDDTTFTALYFRVIAGDGRGEYVVVSLLADTRQARARGGYSRTDVTLRRHQDDWQLRVPVQRAGMQADSDGYALLGPTS